MMIPRQEFRARRAQLNASLKQGSVAIIPAADLLYRNSDTEHHFRQNSDFHYLTGFDFPEAIAVFIPNRAQGEYVLFNQPKNAAAERWTGIRPGQKGAVDEFGADESFPIGSLEEKLPELLADCKHIYYAFGRNNALDALIKKTISHIRDKVRSGLKEPTELINVETVLHEMRLRKSDNEAAIMRKVADISARAHVRAMQACKPGLSEYHLQAEIEYACSKEGANTQAYTPIVAGGDNACILHYVSNDAPLPDDGLVLIDAGSELHNYASDITRTFPVNGKFSDEQRAIYNAVLKTQLAVIDLVKPGTSRDELENKSIEVITSELLSLGLLKGDLSTLIEEKAYMAFYMHRIGHWIGLDVHDVGKYKVDGQWRPLEHGMILTVEPGIYIAPDNTDVDKKWRGIGVRIEDDVLVTKDGHEVLSHAAPKTTDAIEALMA